MQSNAWQRSCVRNPAIKNKKTHAQGAEGGRRKPARGGRGEGEGGGRGGVCFSSGTRLQSEVDVEKPGNGRAVQGEVAACSAPAPESCTWFGQSRFSQLLQLLVEPGLTFHVFFNNFEKNRKS